MLARSPERARESAADIAHCQTLLSNGSRTFFAASFLLPARIREPAAALYAFCRLADDAVDLGGGSSDVMAALERRLDGIYAGAPHDIAADRAFARTVAAFNVPRAMPDALLEGFAWDCASRRYATISDVISYSVRVAGAVGTMMATVMGARQPAALARALDLGVAMQLSNIARDVGEDARAGRLYLPLDWLAEAGIDPDHFLAAPRFTPALGGVVARLLAEADRLYERADLGIALLPADCQPGIRAARLCYAEIGNEVARRGFDSVSSRAVVSAPRKLALLARAFTGWSASSGVSLDEALAEARFLVEAALSHPEWLIAPGAAQDFPPAWWNLRGRAVRTIDLFERLERRHRDTIGRIEPSTT